MGNEKNICCRLENRHPGAGKIWTSQEFWHPSIATLVLWKHLGPPWSVLLKVELTMPTRFGSSKKLGGDYSDFESDHQILRD